MTSKWGCKYGDKRSVLDYILIKDAWVRKGADVRMSDHCLRQKFWYWITM